MNTIITNTIITITTIISPIIITTIINTIITINIIATISNITAISTIITISTMTITTIINVMAEGRGWMWRVVGGLLVVFEPCLALPLQHL